MARRHRFPLQPYPLPPAVAAARAAACLRALADALAQRPAGAPWVDIRWLDPLRRVSAPATVAALRGDAPLIPAERVRHCRISVHSGRQWARRAGGGAWLAGWLPADQTSLWDEVARWANVRPDKRYGLDQRSAAVLRDAAGLLEAEWQLPAQPARWCGQRRSRFDPALYGLGDFIVWQLIESRSGLLDLGHETRAVQGPFDLLDPDSAANQALDPPARRGLQALAERLRAARPQHAWQRAFVSLQAPPEDYDEWRVGFELISQAPFMLQTLWMENSGGPIGPARLIVREWPDVLPGWVEPRAMRAPAPKPAPWFGDSPDFDLNAPIPPGPRCVLDGLPIPRTFHPGLWVRHRTFGAGLVLSVQGEGAQAMAEVQFTNRQIRLLSVHESRWQSVSDTWPPHSGLPIKDPSQTFPSGVANWERNIADLERPPASTYLPSVKTIWCLDLTFRLLITKDIDLLTARGTPPAPELLARIKAADARMMELTLPTEQCECPTRAENPAWRPQDDPVRHFYAWRWPTRWPR